MKFLSILRRSILATAQREKSHRGVIRPEWARNRIYSGLASCVSEFIKNMRQDPVGGDARVNVRSMTDLASVINLR